MDLKLNKVYHLDNREGLLRIPEKSANLIIADPPYFEIKGDFDFVFKSFDEYLDFMEEQAKLYKRILAENGTLFVWGHVKNIAYVQMIFDKYFNLENHITWIKKDGQQYQYYSEETARTFTSNNERILMYSNEIIETGLDRILKMNGFYGLQNYFLEEKKKLGWNNSQIDKYLDIKASSCFWDKPSSHPYRIPEEKHYKKLQETGFYSREYEDLRREYEDLRRPFYNKKRLSDCMEFGQEAHITKLYDHETKKPETLTRVLIQTCSRPGDLVVVPFAGSGTECSMSLKEGRNFIGFDTEEKHVNTSNKRCLKIENSPTFNFI